VTAAKPHHDALYHRFFSDPVIVAQLLREFAAGPWLEGLDLDGLQRLNTKFHADTNEQRDGDLIWRIPRRDGGDAYAMLLLEFQSTPDRWMALRLMVYAGLLWQHLVREQRLLPDGRLPPILPIVLYNGVPRWRAAVDLAALIGLPEDSAMWRWQPVFRYHVIDEGAFSIGDLAERDGLPALLFRLENASAPDQLVEVADAVLAWFGRHPGFQAARAVLVELLSAAVAPLGPGVRVPEAMREVRNMLQERVQQWIEQWKQEGLQAGLQEGLQAGLREGLQAGRLEGRLEGEKQGEERGRQLGEQTGRQQGEAAFLLRLLERRFGVLPGWATDRVLAADTVMLEEWSLRLLDGASLEEVLAVP
jgi:predicted transposase YdaD